jgi:curved DNA-binding protein CbpA
MSHYETLGVPPSADEKEIKRAYFQLVRKHTPDKDPLVHQQIREAYEVLSDPAKRSSYDSQGRHGDRVQALVTQAEVMLREGQLAKGETLLKEALVLDPACHQASNRLAVCWLLQGRADQGTALLERLTKEHPDESLYWMNLGHARLDKMGGEVRSDQLIAALMAFREAVRLDSTRSDAHMMIAEIFLQRKNFEGALSSAEDALRVHGGKDLGDLDAHLLVVWVNLLLGRREPMASSIASIEQITRDEPEARAFAAEALSRMGDAARGGLLVFPRMLLEAAHRLVPHDIEKKSQLAALVGTEGIEGCYSKYRLEPGVPAAFRRLVDVLYRVHSGGGPDDAEIDRSMRHIEEDIAQKPEAFTKAVEQLRDKYAPLYKLEPQLFDQIGCVFSVDPEATNSDFDFEELNPANSTLLVGFTLLVIAAPTFFVNPGWSLIPATLGAIVLIIWTRIR